MATVGLSALNIFPPGCLVFETKPKSKRIGLSRAHRKTEDGMKKAVAVAVLFVSGLCAQQEAQLQPAVYYPGESAQIVPVVARRHYARRRYRRAYVVRRRSRRKSVAIVAGSAAGGAAIGALAGGGKGAAIGALVGGGGGLVYDRATHKKVVRTN